MVAVVAHRADRPRADDPAAAERLTVASLDRVGAAVAGSDHKLRKRIEAAVNDARKELSETMPESIVTAANGFDVDDSGEAGG